MEKEVHGFLLLFATNVVSLEECAQPFTLKFD